MKRAASPSGKNSQPSAQFNHRLQMYSLAAGATGVGLLALAPLANAEIVYTATNVTIGARILHSYALDLNGDGTTDFFINATSRQSIDQSGGTSRIIAMPAVKSNGVVVSEGDAAALNAGHTIGSGSKFARGLMASVFTFIGTEITFRGPWANVKERYLGLKFEIDGQTHFGWARLSVGGKALLAKLTGFAYETLADTPIIAGKTSGTSDAALPPAVGPAMQIAPVTLGALAVGAPAIPAWRREETAITTAN